MNYYYRQQIKETKATKLSIYPINPHVDIQLKAMTFEKMNRSQTAGKSLEDIHKKYIH